MCHCVTVRLLIVSHLNETRADVRPRLQLPFVPKLAALGQALCHFFLTRHTCGVAVSFFFMRMFRISTKIEKAMAK